MIEKELKQKLLSNKSIHFIDTEDENVDEKEKLVGNLIQYGDSWKKIEDNVIEFYAIMIACTDYPIALMNYSGIDEIIQTDDFEETIKDYRELAKQRIIFNSLSESESGVERMTENKRYMVDDAGTLIDIETRECFDMVEDVVDVLNEQEEEIQELKIRNKRQYKLLTKITDLMTKRDWNGLEKIVEVWEESDRLIQRELGNY